TSASALDRSTIGGSTLESASQKPTFTDKATRTTMATSASHLRDPPRRAGGAGVSLAVVLLVARFMGLFLDSAVAFLESHDGVNAWAGKKFRDSVRPKHLDALKLIGRPESEVGARIIAARVTVGGVEPARPASRAGVNRYFR